MARKNKRKKSELLAQSRAFVFEAIDRIGAAGAEDDDKYLESCFVDTGNLALLQKPNDIRHIVLGRTGTGKSALLRKLQEEAGEFAIPISPRSLALNYVSNSTVLKYFSDLGVNLDPFFKLLWRHVVTVEILSHHFDREAAGSNDKKSLLDWVRSFFESDTREDKRRRESIKYLEEWGTKFWLETEYRVQEITDKIEAELTANVKSKFGIDVAHVEAGMAETRTLSEEQRVELKSYGQQIISKAQVQDLNSVLDTLDSVLSDPQQPYFVVIDALDEDWVEDRLKYKLIMALIQTARDFNAVQNAKVVLALRRDLIERVFRLARDSGFQEEKYESMYLRVTWSPSQLIELLDIRISELAREKRAIEGIGISKMLPIKYKNTPIRDYIVQLAPRPRDIISFFNCCINSAIGKSKLRTSELKIAEGEYSRLRLRALGDEWSGDHPNLLDFACLLQKKPKSFKLSSLQESEIEDICIDIAADYPNSNDDLVRTALKLVDEKIAPLDALIDISQVFYQVGLVGLKTEAFESESWADELGRSISRGDVDCTTSVVVHPMFHRALGIKD